MGVVYEVRDTLNDQRVALKTLRAVEPQTLYRLKQEFRALQGIEQENLIRLGELHEHRGEWFYTMELVDGEDFLSYVRPGTRAPTADGTPREDSADRTADTMPGRFSFASPRADRSPDAIFDEGRLRSSLRQLAHAVVALHEAGKIHRDIKPSNVLVARGGRVVLLDFGLVTDRVASLQSSDGRAVGTAAYMAPEQASGETVGPASDWYSVGVVLYQALTGALPHAGAPVELLMEKQTRSASPPHVRVPGLPEDLDQLCEALLQFDPALRPSGREILRRLGDAEADDHDYASGSQSHGGHGAEFLGREAELGVLEACFQRVLAGEAVSVFVHGESGVGKTALLEQFAAQARDFEPRTVVLRGRCFERESVPYKAFDGVVDALSHHMKRLSPTAAVGLAPRNARLLLRLFPVLGRVEAFAQAPQPVRPVEDPHELRTRVFDALQELLSKLAERVPVVLMIDDLQWVDADSLPLLSAVFRARDPAPLLLLASSRSGSLPGEERTGQNALPDDTVRLEVGPLDATAATDLARRLVEHAHVSDAVAPEVIASEARGHPLYIDELVRHAAAAAERTAAPRVRLEDAIWARVSVLPEPQRGLVELAAVAGEPIALETLRLAAELDRAEFVRALGVLRVAHLLKGRGGRDTDRIETYHDRVRESVLQELPEETMEGRHRRLAIALESSIAGRERPDLLVRHLVGAGQAKRAAECAAEAAARAGEALAFDRAAALYRTALEIGTYDTDARSRLGVALGEALANAGRGAEAAEAYLDAAEGASKATRRECQRLAAEQLLITGHIERGLATIGDLLAEADAPIPATPRRALLSLMWQRLRLRLRGLGWKETDEWAISGKELTRLDVYQVVSQGLAMVDNIRAAECHARTLSLALKLGDGVRIGRALALEAIFRSSQGGKGLARGRELARRAMEIAEERGAQDIVGYGLHAEGCVNYFDGRFRVAVERWVEAEQRLMALDRPSTLWINNARLFRVFALRRLGALAERSRLVQGYVEDAMQRGDRYAETCMRRENALDWLRLDDVAGARENLALTSWTAPAGGFHLQHWYELQAEAEIHIYEGSAPGAVDWAEERFQSLRRSMLLRVQIVRCLANYVCGRFWIAAATDQRQRDRGTREAAACARALERESMSYADVFAGLLRASLAWQRGDQDAAAASLRAAEATAERCEMAHLTTAARYRLGGILHGEARAALGRKVRPWLDAEGVESAERFAELFVPGFAERGA